MKTLIYGKDALPDSGCVVALGFFDGVHRAHRSLIAKARTLADELSLPLAIFTFPSESSKLKVQSSRLYSTEEKLELLSECGVDLTVLADFPSICDKSPDEFVNETLIGDLGARAVAIGYNFTYGKNRGGNADTMKTALDKIGVKCIVAEEERLLDNSLSTTYVRGLLDSLRLKEAAIALGKPYFLSGEVVRGNGKGRLLGVPTVNTTLNSDRYNLKVGVYATITELDGKLFPSLTNLGYCPTFGRRELHAETDILGFDGDLYGRKIRVYFVEYLREEIEFSSENELIKQINIDKEAAKRFESEALWQELGLK